MNEKDRAILSVVVPVYNGSKYVETCVRNIQNQTFQNYEVIIVNDGSTDNSKEVIDFVIEDDKRFRVIHQKNGGTARARNAGLDVAVGKYILFLDVDDEYKPEMFEVMIHEIEKNYAELVVCGFFFKIESDKSGKLETTYLEEKKYPYSVFHTFDEMRPEYIDIWDSDMFSNVWNKLYSMDTIRKFGMRFRDGHVYTEDRVFNRLFLSKCQSVVLIDQCLYFYIRERIGSTTEKYRDDSFVIRNKEYNEFKEHFCEMNIWNKKSREYTSREFIERIAGCIENVFHAKDTLTIKQKYQIIDYMVKHSDTREAVRYAKCRSKKMKIFVLPIKLNCTSGVFLMGWLIFEIRKMSPELFHRLKSRR